MPSFRISAEPIDIKLLYGDFVASLTSGESGAVATFTGLVRDFNQGNGVVNLELEHYPGMCEKAISLILEEAKSRWSINEIFICHRVGKLEVSDPVVFVAVASAHRQDSFSGCAYVMDQLKTRVPFWKKELTSSGKSIWVENRCSDIEAAERWK